MRTRVHSLLAWVGGLAWVLGAVPCVQAASISETRTEAENTVVMENAFVRMTIDVRSGAKVTGFFYKPLQREWISSGHALFADHVWQQTWPGELYRTPYEYKITQRGPKQVAVTVWRALQRKGMDSIIGVRVERTLTLRDDSPVVRADVVLSNPTPQVKTVGYWSQHIFRLGGLDDNYFIRPSTAGLDLATLDYRDGGTRRERVGDDWVKSPVAGWTASLNPTTGEAGVFLMDYNDLRWLYNCLSGYTTEWYYDLLRMEPGRTWRTTFYLVPAHGYRSLSFASRQALADVRLMRCPEGFRLVYTVGCAEAPLKDVSLGAIVRSGDRKRTIGRETVTFGAVSYAPREFVSALTVPAKGEPFIVTVALRTDGVTHTFEKPFGAHNRTDHLVAGVFDTGYAVPRPPKHKKLDRPATVRKVPHAGVAVFEARGQFYPAWRLAEALRGLGKHTLKPGHFSSNVYGEQLDYFPAGYREIMGLDAVVLNNVSAGALSANDQALLVDYVRHGGGLLVLGGWYAFGGGQYATSALAEVLPVECGRAFDIRPHPRGLPLKGAPGGVFAGVDLSENPVALWVHDVASVKPGAHVAMTAGDKPLVVTGTFGRGRVACVLASVTGEAPPPGTAFFECRQWPALLGRIVQWLKGDGAR